MELCTKIRPAMLLNALERLPISIWVTNKFVCIVDILNDRTWTTYSNRLVSLNLVCMAFFPVAKICRIICCIFFRYDIFSGLSWIVSMIFSV